MGVSCILRYDIFIHSIVFIKWLMGMSEGGLLAMKILSIGLSVGALLRILKKLVEVEFFVLFFDLWIIFNNG
jgi:hypothetical protein